MTVADEVGTTNMQAPVTLAAYAAARALDKSWLQREFGVTDGVVEGGTLAGTTCVVMPYKDETGHTVAVKYRIALHGPDRFRWRQGDHAAGRVYGLDRLRQYKGPVLWITVGESNLHALIAHNLEGLATHDQGETPHPHTVEMLAATIVNYSSIREVRLVTPGHQAAPRRVRDSVRSFSESRMRENCTSGSTSGKWKRSRAGLVRPRQTKEPDG